MGRAGWVLWNFTVRLRCKRRKIMFFHEIVVVLKRDGSQIFEEVSNDVTKPWRFRIVFVKCHHFISIELLDIFSYDLIFVTGFLPANSIHQSSPCSRGQGNRVDKALGLMEESRNEIKVILLIIGKILKTCKFNDGDYWFLFLIHRIWDRISDNMKSRIKKTEGTDLLVCGLKLGLISTTKWLIIFPWNTRIEIVSGIFDSIPNDWKTGWSNAVCIQTKEVLFVTLCPALLLSLFPWLIMMTTNHIMSPGGCPPRINQEMTLSN